jgi:hypothetical protein
MTTARQLRERVNEAVIQALEQQLVPWPSDQGFSENRFQSQTLRRHRGGLAHAGLPAPGAHVLLLAKDEWEALGGKVEGGPGTLVIVRSGGLFESLRRLTVYDLCQVAGDFPASRNERLERNRRRLHAARDCPMTPTHFH